MKYVFCFLAACTIVLSTNSFLKADSTWVSGTIIGDTWTAENSPYCVNGDINVASLQIDPGVDIVVFGNYIFTVAGVLNAIGLENEPILFTADSSAGSWQGILYQNSVPGSEMAWCIVQKANTSGIRIIESVPVIHNCTIINSQSVDNGGGLKISLSSPDTLIIANCTISDNEVSTNYTMPSSNGGGIWVSASDGLVQFFNCNISNNYAYRADGNVYGGGVIANGNVEFIKCLISDNYVYGHDGIPGGSSSGRGGGIYISGGAVTVANTIISNNTSRGYATGGMSGNSGYAYGGGICISDGQVFLRNSIIAGNTGTSTHGTYGGGIYTSAGLIDIENCTITYNNPYGIYDNAGATFINSIIYFNSGGQISGSSSISYSDIQGGYTGTGNIDYNPVLYSEDSLIIVEGSPCIDAGDPDSLYYDLCFPPSLGTDINDMGAHGGAGGCDWITFLGYQYLPGDANMYNGTWPPSVIGSDVTYLVNYFRGLETNPACLIDGYYMAADINASCTVIGSDVTRLVNFFRGAGEIEFCPDWEPAWYDASELPEEVPAEWPNCDEDITSGLNGKDGSKNIN